MAPLRARPLLGFRLGCLAKLQLGPEVVHVRDAQLLHHGYAFVRELGGVGGAEDDTLPNHLFAVARGGGWNLVATDVAEVDEPRCGDEGWRGEEEIADSGGGGRSRAGKLAWVRRPKTGAGAGRGGGGGSGGGLDTHLVGCDGIMILGI